MKKLTLDEMSDQMTVISDKCGSIKGGDAGYSVLSDGGSSSSTVYTSDEYYAMVENGTWSGGWIVGADSQLSYGLSEITVVNTLQNSTLSGVLYILGNNLDMLVKCLNTGFGTILMGPDGYPIIYDGPKETAPYYY